MGQNASNCCNSYGLPESIRVLDGLKIGRIHWQLQGLTSQRCGLLPSDAVFYSDTIKIQIKLQ